MADETEQSRPDVEQQLAEMQAKLQKQQEELARAEAERDEAGAQVTRMENRLNTERMLAEAGVVDVEAASLLLAKRLDLAESLDGEALSRQVEQLLLDKPFLRKPPAAPLPPRTASARPARAGLASQMAEAAQRAVESGSRRDIAEYLRLRRQNSRTVKPTGK